MLSQDEIKQIKEQLLKQIESWPEEQRENAKTQIESMNAKELEEFLEKNHLIKSSESQQCIFCSIIENKIPSHKIAENEKAVAILEINPISEGHMIIIPKSHVSATEIPDKAIELANQISELLKLKLNPEKVEIASAEIMGHGIINVFPVYDNENINSKRRKADNSELENLKTQLIIKPEEKQTGQEMPRKIYKVQKRIP